MFNMIDVDSSAEDVDFSWDSPTLRTTNYDIATVTFAKAASGLTHKASDADIELGRFTLKNTNLDEKIVEFKSMTLRQKE
jgi:hypothetical protein